LKIAILFRKRQTFHIQREVIDRPDIQRLQNGDQREARHLKVLNSAAALASAPLPVALRHFSVDSTQGRHARKVPELGHLHLVGKAGIQRMGSPLARHNLLEHVRIGLDQNAVPAALQLEKEAVGEELAVKAARFHIEAVPLRSQQAVDVLGLTYAICQEGERQRWQVFLTDRPFQGRNKNKNSGKNH